MTLEKKIKVQLELTGQTWTQNSWAPLIQTLEHTDRCDSWKPTINRTSFFYNPVIFSSRMLFSIFNDENYFVFLMTVGGGAQGASVGLKTPSRFGMF